MKTVPLGTTGHSEVPVTAEVLASRAGSGAVPVFSTPSLVLLMEQAAVNAIKDFLDAGETTVGTRLDIRHIASTPPGLVVSATAKVSGFDGRRLTFQVEARDSFEVVGTGTHERFVVNSSRFISRANEKSTRKNRCSVEE